MIRVTRGWCGLVLLASLTILAACTDDITRPQPRIAHTAIEHGQVLDGVHDHFPMIRRVGVRVELRGPFRPGVPFSIRAVARGNRRASQAQIEVLGLDWDSAGSSGRGVRIAEWNGTLERGATAAVDAAVTIPEAGYYRIIARAVGTGSDVDRARLPRDTAVVDQTAETYWVLVDQQGGRVTEGYDPAVLRDTTRVLLFGSSGPFRARTAVGVSSSASTAPQRQAGVSSASTSPVRAATATATCGSVAVFCGTVRYRALDQSNMPLVPVANASLTGKCWDSTRQYSTNFYGYTTDQTGHFVIDCNMWGFGLGGMTLNPPSLSSTTAYVEGAGGTAVGSALNVYGSSSSTLDYRLSNDHAGRTFDLLSQYGPTVPARFGGYTRNPVLVYVSTAGSDTDGCDGAYLSVDRIDLTRTCVFGNYGTFVVLHEYGHAYQYKALEPERSYTCNSTDHFVDSAYTLSCAYVEGFADFFSAWVLQDRLPANGFDYSNYLFEINPYRDNGDGSKIEGAVAAFLLDMVDGSADADGLSGDDDSVTWPGSYVSDLIRTCSPGGLTSIDGIDEFIYCAEHDVTARLANPYDSWRTYASVTEGASEPAGWSAATVRSLWRYNLYNLGANP